MKYRPTQGRDHGTVALPPAQGAETLSRVSKKYGLENILPLTMGEQRAKEQLSMLFWALVEQTSP